MIYLVSSILVYIMCRTIVHMAIMQSKHFDYAVGLLTREQWESLQRKAWIVSLIMASMVQILFLRIFV